MEDPGIAAIERVYLELKELGVSEEGIKRKLSQLGEGCKIEFDTIVGEAMQIKRDLEERVDTALVDVQKLAAELGEEASDFDDRTLNTYIVDLEDRKESMEEVKADRKAQMNESLSELKALYEEFEEIPPSNHGEIGGTYTEERMRELQHAVERVRDEKKRRRNEVASRVAEISQMWNILGTSLEEKKNTQFADVLLSEGRGSIGLSRDNSKSLESILYSLVEEKERREETIKQLKGQIQKIWERLHISEQARLEFLNGASQGLTMSSVNTCSDELKRLKLLQRQQSEKIIGEIRMNIQNLWEKMRLSEDEQRDTFPGFFQDVFNDETLNEHEEQLKSARLHLQERAPILAMVEDREKKLKRIADFREKDSVTVGKERYNRKFLKEQEQINKLEKEGLRKDEAKLKNRVSTFEAEQKMVFCIDGVPFLDSLVKQIREREAKKEERKRREKQKREEAKMKKRQELAKQSTYVKQPRSCQTPKPRNRQSSRFQTPRSAKPSRSRTPSIQSRTAKKAPKGQRRMETPHPKIHAVKKPTRIASSSAAAVVVVADKNENEAPRNEIKGEGKGAGDSGVSPLDKTLVLAGRNLKQEMLATKYGKASELESEAAKMRQNGNLEQARDLYSQALQQATSSPMKSLKMRLYLERSKVFNQLGELSKAVEDTNSALELEKDVYEQVTVAAE